MRALHVITGLGAGGAEQQLRLLLRHLPGTHDVVTLTNPGQVADGLRQDGVRVADLRMAGNRDLGALPRLTRLVRTGRYDIVHTHLYRACLYGRIAARLAGVPGIVATEHSLGDTQIEGRPLTQGVRALYLAGERLGRATIAVSPAVAGRLHRWGVAPHRVHVVPNGVDVDRFAFDAGARATTRARYGLPPDAFVIGGVGRLVPGKRFGVLIEALAQLPDDVRLLLVGTGPEETALEAAARAAGVRDRVVFTGERPHTARTAAAGPDLPALFSAMDLLASPSTDEAFGLAVVEAQASGLPVVHVHCPALDDLPGARRPGDTVRVPCEAASFARETETARTRPPAPRTPARAALHYSIARSAARHLGVYEAALGAAPTPGVNTR